MSDLAFKCWLLKIPVNPARLYYDYDPNFLLWLEQVANRINAHNREEAAKVKKG